MWHGHRLGLWAWQGVRCSIWRRRGNVGVPGQAIPRIRGRALWCGCRQRLIYSRLDREFLGLLILGVGGRWIFLWSPNVSISYLGDSCNPTPTTEQKQLCAQSTTGALEERTANWSWDSPTHDCFVDYFADIYTPTQWPHHEFSCRYMTPKTTPYINLIKGDAEVNSIGTMTSHNAGSVGITRHQIRRNGL